MHPSNQKQKTPNLQSARRCLAFLCCTLNFDVAEVWNRTEDGQLILAAVYATPRAAQIFRTVSKANTDDHKISLVLCEKAMNAEDVVYFTSASENAPIHSTIKTAVGLKETSLDSNLDIFVIGLAVATIHFDPLLLGFFRRVAKAIAVVTSPMFDPGRVLLELSSESSISMMDTTEINNVKAVLSHEKDIDLNVPWTDLVGLSFLRNDDKWSRYAVNFHGIPAIVKMTNDAVVSEESFSQLENEISFYQRLHHPNILEIYGAGHNTSLFSIIEKLSGGILADMLDLPSGSSTSLTPESSFRISKDMDHSGHTVNSKTGETEERSGKSTPLGFFQKIGNTVTSFFKHKKKFLYAEVLKFALQLASALCYLHDQAIPGHRVIHRNLSPESVGFQRTTNGELELKLLKFELACVVEKKSTPEVFQLDVVGDSLFLAPEVSKRILYNEKCDIYGFALIVWSLKSMHRPYSGISQDFFYENVVNGTVRPKCKSKWPSEFSQLLNSCWNQDFTKRPSASELLIQLQTLLANENRMSIQKRGSLPLP